ncbi:hypothetical protein [Pontibacter roseus]|uniref:hypothetical protein n=1 Tax=Pontibacter roseus TaxID=336989 RepID=UPI000376434C|nr:hypothetical protein [Pontibacter roseus]
MRHNERNYDSGYQNQHSRGNQNPDHDLSNYLTRYESRGNYYGMPDQQHEYRDVRSQGRNYGDSASGPGGGYGASSWRSNYDQDNRHTQGQMHQNEWGGNSDRDNYNYGSGSRSQSSDHYRYGDPNPYMNYQRQGGYEKTRGTGWRSESDVDHSNRRYSRQDNSYQQTGHGRRFDQYGQDERYNYAHGQQDGRRSVDNPESLDDRYYDRGEHSSSSSDNDYGNRYGTNYDHRNRDRQGRDDNYATGSYSSNRAYLADHGQDRDEGTFDRTSDDYPSRSPRGYGQSSGPDYSASSPITNYGPSVRGYQK